MDLNTNFISQMPEFFLLNMHIVTIQKHKDQHMVC
jgi:hypothetical protein